MLNKNPSITFCNCSGKGLEKHFAENPRKVSLPLSREGAAGLLQPGSNLLLPNGDFSGRGGGGDRLLRRSPRRGSSASFVWRSSRKWVKAVVVSAGSLGRAVRVLLATWPIRTHVIPAPPSRMTSTTAAAWPRPACTSAWVRGGWPGDLGENEFAK